MSVNSTENVWSTREALGVGVDGGRLTRWSLLGVGLAATVIGCTREPEPMRPPDYGLLGIEVSEPSLGRRHDHPTEFKPRDDLVDLARWDFR